MTDDIDTGDIDELAPDILADSPYDTELGTRMARDARRVANDDMSPEEFETRYADAVAEEFDVDLTETDRDAEPGVPAVEPGTSRRSMLKATGAVASGLAVAGGGSSLAGEYVSGDGVAAAQPEGGNAGQRGMVLDTEACIKCLSCVEACKEENHTPKGHFWMEVDRYQLEDETYEGPTDCESVQQPCQHCDDAPCIEVCPNNSRFKTEDGRTVCDYDTCLGCKYCEVACPYHVNAFVYTDQPEYLDGEFDQKQRDEEGRWLAGTPPHGSCSKCTFCVHREWDPDQRGTTACEDACPIDAIHFGDLEDPESDPNQYLEENSDMNQFKLRDDVSDPNVIYLGDDPTDAEVTEVPGPTTHEDLDLEEPDPTH